MDSKKRNKYGCCRKMIIGIGELEDCGRKKISTNPIPK
jgi:hypothetical protein